MAYYTESETRTIVYVIKMSSRYPIYMMMTLAVFGEQRTVFIEAVFRVIVEFKIGVTVICKPAFNPWFVLILFRIPTLIGHIP